MKLHFKLKLATENDVKKGNISFTDDKGHTPESLYITNTMASYNMQKDPNKCLWGTLPEGNSFKVVITGYSDAEGKSETGKVEYFLGNYPTGGTLTVVDSWEEVDLTPLGTVKNIVFEAVTTERHAIISGVVYSPQPSRLFAIDDIKFSN